MRKKEDGVYDHPALRIPMKLIATTLLCSSALLGFGETLETKASKGDVLKRTFTHTSESSLDSMSTRKVGEEDGGVEEDRKRETKSSWRLVVRDVLGEVEDGVVNSAERTYLGLSGESADHSVEYGGKPRGWESTDASELQDKTVLLTAEEFEDVAIWGEGSEGADKLLQGLDIADDFGILLPEAAVELNGTWTIPASLFSLLANPIGDTHLIPEDESEGIKQEGLIPPIEELELEDDTMEAKLVEIVEEDGRKLARVEFQIELTGAPKLTEGMDFMDLEDFCHSPEGVVKPEDDSTESETSYSGKGSFLWDLEGGHLHSLEIKCKTQCINTWTYTMDLDGQEVTTELVSESSGTEAWTVKYELQS
jgi:hypothetical protein